MSDIKLAVEEFLEKQRKVYEADQERLVRDARSARETEQSHLGRWPLELIQNSDDAGATEVRFRVAESAVYVADNGRGLDAAAVRSLAGTHLSLKPVGTIGSKGLGFKAVYEITASPEVYSGEDGIVFSPTRAAEWLRGKGLSPPERPPYEWLPFWEPRDAASNDPVLSEWRALPTVVKLPLRDATKPELAVAALMTLNAHALLAFPHLRSLHVDTGSRSFRLEVAPSVDADGFWEVLDTRDGSRGTWRVLRRKWDVPESALAELEPAERQRARTATGLVATVEHGTDGPVPLDSVLPIAVYYPTKEAAPFSLLLHGDFVVSSDRQSILSPESSAFNRWLAERLADLTLDFVEGARDSRSPARGLGLLRPVPAAITGPTASLVRDHVHQKAVERLRLPNMEGSAVLRVDEARFFGSKEGASQARAIIAGSPLGATLVHADLEATAATREVLRWLGAREVSDEEVLGAIAAGAPESASGQEWLKHCWAWLCLRAQQDKLLGQDALWLGRIRALPILPTSDAKCGALGKNIAAWRPAGGGPPLPDWFHVRLVEDWFRDWVLGLRGTDPVRTFVTELGIKELDDEALLKSFSEATARFWEDESGDPGKFIEFLRTRDWESRFRPEHAPQRCPLLVRKEGDTSKVWMTAGSCYFGPEWGETELARLYEGVSGVPWVLPQAGGKDAERRLLEWLGVRAFPRVVPADDDASANAEASRVRRRMSRAYSMLGEVPRAQVLDRVKVDTLAPERQAALLTLLARNWGEYYLRAARVLVEYYYYSWRQATVPALWWDQLSTEWTPSQKSPRPATPFARCWLPKDRAIEALKPLLPVLDLGAVSEAERPGVEEWCRTHAGIRARADQVTPGEWVDLFREWIPAGVVGTDVASETVQKRVRKWTEAALEALADRTDVNSIANVPLLCRRAAEWRVVGADEPRFLNDDPEAGDALGGVVWLFQVKKGHRATAKRLLEIRPLSGAVTRVAVRGAPVGGGDELNAQMEAAKPFLYAWLADGKNEAADLARRLKDLRARLAQGITARLTVEGVEHAQQVSCGYDIEEEKAILWLDAEDASVTTLAEAVATWADGRREDAHFVENLLRCDSDDERREKLRRVGMTADDIATALHEYAKGDAEDEHAPPDHRPAADSAAVTAGPEAVGPSAPAPSNGGQEGGGRVSLEAVSVQGVPEGTTPASSPSIAPERQRATDPVGSSQEPGPPRELKDSSAPARIVKRGKLLMSERQARRRTSSAERQEGEREGPFEPRMTESEALEIEARGKDVAMQALREMGYEKVESMPQRNPGFDIRATRGSDVLLVEVKAHRGSEQVVTLTAREYKEYQYCIESGGTTRWELWNIEYLGAGSGEAITIMRFAALPEAALRPAMYHLDLRRCATVDG